MQRMMEREEGKVIDWVGVQTLSQTLHHAMYEKLWVDEEIPGVNLHVTAAMHEEPT